MRTLPEKYLSEIPVDEDTYKVDFQVLDRYQSFSAELLRLALLGLTAYGFLLVNVFFEVAPGGAAPGARLAQLDQGIEFFVVGAFALVVSAACSLGHRYFSTDCMTHHVRKLRLRHRLTQDPAAATESVIDAEELHRGESITATSGASLHATILVEASSLRTDLAWCKWLLLGSTVFLFIGTLSIAGAFAIVLLRP
jgi:hypothetical protein